MVSEVNMVSSGRPRPAPGLPPVPHLSLRPKSVLPGRALAGLRGAAGAVLSAWKLYFPRDALSPSPSCCRGCARLFRPSLGVPGRLTPLSLLPFFLPEPAGAPPGPQHLPRVRRAERAGGGGRRIPGAGGISAVHIFLLLGRFRGKKAHQASLSVDKFWHVWAY